MLCQEFVSSFSPRSRRSSRKRAAGVCPRCIWSSIQIILNEGHLPLTVTDLAHRAGLGVVQYRKLFQQAVGQSPKAYIRQTRLTRARALLETDPHMPLKEVADRAGFSDARYLHQVFREQHGTTPGRYWNRGKPSSP